MRNRSDREFLKHLGNNIRAARKAAGLTQEQAAALIPMGRSALSDIEMGYHSPMITTLKRIAEVLNKDIKYFL